MVTKEKIFTSLRLTNIVIVCLISPLMAFVLLFAINPLSEGRLFDPVFIQAFGYFIALAFGLLSFWKHPFLILSLIGWMLFGLGFWLDKSSATEERNAACIEMRQDPNCTEKDSSMFCTSGKYAGVYPEACVYLPK